MKAVLKVFLQEDGSLNVGVEPTLGSVFDSKEELFNSFDSDLIEEEVQKLLSVVAKKMGIK